MELWKSLRGPCCGNAGFTKEIGQSAEQAATWERVAGRESRQIVGKNCRQTVWDIGQSAVGDVLGRELTRGMDVP